MILVSKVATWIRQFHFPIQHEVVDSCSILCYLAGILDLSVQMCEGREGGRKEGRTIFFCQTAFPSLVVFYFSDLVDTFVFIKNLFMVQLTSYFTYKIFSLYKLQSVCGNPLQGSIRHAFVEHTYIHVHIYMSIYDCRRADSRCIFYINFSSNSIQYFLNEICSQNNL